ncbi:beta strand repeat-containing protein [Luteolibacter soli]|uniref:Autotransporter-associated beta strand repeat-containing protein n=1 Tax=Luteolibacter soli TaxID=3135280 RepID=A0ABU9AV98_9BACT
MKKPTNSLLALLAAVPALPLTATAGTYAWTGTTSGSWTPTVTANWNGATPVFDNAADVTFGDTPAIGNYITYLNDGPRMVRSISLNGTLANPLEIRTNNNSTTARQLQLSAASGPAQINIAATVTQTLNIGQGTGTNANGTVNLSSDLEVNHNGSALATISRPINEGVAGRSLTKNGTGTLLLSAANTYTGTTTINAGILRIGNAAGLGATSGDTIVNSGGTLDVNNQIIAAGETITINGAGQGGIGALYQSTGSAGAGNIVDNLVLAGPSTIGAATGTRYGIGANGTSTTTGLYTLTKVGPGQFDLRGQVTIGNIIVNEGALQTEGVAQYNNDGYTLTVNSGAAFRSFEIVNPFTRNIVLNGGKLISNGTLPAGNLYTGNLTLSGATGIENNGGDGDLMIFTGNASESAPGASLTITGTRRVVLAGTNTYTGPTNVTSGIFQASGSFTSDIVVTGTTTLDGEGSTTGAISLSSGATLVFDPSTTGANQYLRAADVVFPDSAVINVIPKVTAPGSNIVVLHDNNGGLSLDNFYLVNPGRGVLTLGGAGGNSDLLYSFPAANLEWRGYTNNDWLETDGALNFRNTASNAHEDFYSRDNVDFTDAATGTITVLSAVTPGNVVFKNTAGHDIAFSTLGAGSIDALSITTTPATTGNLTFDVPLTGQSPLTLNGTGIVTLSAGTSSTGTITLNAGTLQIGGSLFAGSITAPVVNNTAITSTRTDTATLSGIISGPGTFTQSGTGTTLLTGENTYTGLTTVSAGTLQVGTGTTGSITGDILNNANVQFTRSNNTTYTGTITGTGSVVKNGTGTFTLAGSNSYSGGTSIINGILLTTDASIGTGPVSIGTSGANTSTLSIAGGTIDNDIYFPNAGTGLKIINLATGSLDAALSGTIHLDADTGTGAGVSRISPATGTIVISGKMTGSGLAGYSKRNTGTVIITNLTNDYTGPTAIVDAGTLIVDGRVPSSVFFGEGAGVGGTGILTGTLAGSGTIGGNVKLEMNSRLSPGGTSAAGVNADTRATLTIQGGLDAALIGNGTGRLLFQLGAPAGSNDRVNVGGVLNLGGGTIGLTELVLTDAGGLAAGTYTLIHANGGITGTLDPANLTGTVGTGLNGALSVSGSDLILTVTSTGNPYTTWAATFAGLTDTSFELDFDHDGLSTGLEWVLGGNPTINDAASITPALTANAASGLTLAFKREEDSIGIATLSVEYGTTLTTWPGTALIGATTTGPDANGVTVTINPTPDPDNVTVTIPATNANNNRLYARLKATLP